MRKEISLYPKTTRFNNRGEYIITEKMDGSNVCFYKHNGILHIASRKYVWTQDELNSDIKGLRAWIEKYGDDLRDSLNEGSVICGEWIGQGKIKYINMTDENRYCMFAKANLELDKSGEVVGLKNILYKPELFVYPFESQELPVYINTVPTIVIRKEEPSLQYLNYLYNEYCLKAGRAVEGFIVLAPDRSISKYVRYKDGKLTDHHK